MSTRKSKRPTWKKLLSREKLLQLPSAWDALTAKLIERAGFPAYQVGGFALDGARFGLPDVDLTRLGEKSEAIREILGATDVPVLVDADDGYGDVKNVSYTVGMYEEMGASAIFIEDQQPPKRCGHMAGKTVIAAQDMAAKVRAAAAARSDRDALFLIARTDAIETDGLDEALRRGELYLKSGADGVYVEGPRSKRELQRIGREFRGVPQVANILEGGGKTPWVAPEQLREMGFSMVLYPTTLLFRMARAVERGLQDLRDAHPMPENEAVSMREFEEIVGLPHWAYIENRFKATKALGLVQYIWQKIAS